MDRLDSSQREILSSVFEQLNGWRKTRKTQKMDFLKFRWRKFHLHVIHGYVLKLNITAYSSLISAATLLNTGTSLVNHEFSDNKVASFMQALHEVFVVPQHHQLFEWDAGVKKNGVVAAFIDMLLRLLHIWPASVEDWLEYLKKGLRFLLGVLGDESFICNCNVQHMWPQFEAVANKAGIMVYVVIFSREVYPVSERSFADLLRDMDELESRIINLSKQQQCIGDAWITRNTAVVDSLFIVNSLVHDLQDLLNQEDDSIVAMKDQIKTVQQELKLWNSLINNQEVEEYYMMQIRDVAFESEYLMNYFLNGDDLRSQIYLSNRLSHVIRKIKSIKSGIQASQKNNDNDVPRFSQLSLQTKSSNYVSEVIGLEDKEMEILQYLESGKEDLQIVSIVGMAGLGKTTLARKVYHHPSLKYKFDVCSWCVVSQHYEKKKLLIDILMTFKDGFDKEEMVKRKKEMLKRKEESLTTMIHQFLYKRRYFIILDDVWSSDAWFDIQACFPNNGIGSRILLTSRNRNVAPTGSIICELPPMSDENCLELLRKKVFRNEPCPPHLLNLGQKIAKNCRGLPLAVVVTAGILSAKDTKEESTWKEVEENLASYVMSDESNSIMKIVELSYNNLPDNLKPCFLHFGVHPKQMVVQVGILCALWISEGFVRREEKKRAESVAEEYLRELVDRSLVTVVGTGFNDRMMVCSFHDLLHEFCLRRCQEENLHTLVDKNYSSLLSEKNQRFCIFDSVSFPRSPLFGLHVRSILGYFPRSGFLNMKLLKVLVLEGRVGYGSLNEIKFLANLRCLVIDYRSPSTIKELKIGFISSLINLEFLTVNTNFYLIYTPSEIAKMMKLIYICANLVRFGEESITTNNILEILGNVTIRELKDEQMLRCSPHLLRLECKCFPLVVEETGELRFPDFSFFTQLEWLHIEAGVVNTVMDMSLPLNLKELSLFGVYLPWEKISIMGRLPNLQLLKLDHFGGSDGEVWETRDGEFQQLKMLVLESLNNLREWRVESSSHFPRLQYLELNNCEHLEEFPAAVGEIATLEEVEIEGRYQETLLESVREIEQELQEDGNELLMFYID